MCSSDLARDGTLFYLVDELSRAWHAGDSSWGGGRDLNSASIGIEIDNDGEEPYTEEQVQAMQANVCSIADGEGLCYDLSGTLSGNTADAHRLLLWAGDKQAELLEQMYSHYFEHGGALFSHDDLVTVAVSVGLDADMVRQFLAGDDLADQVEADQQQAHSLGASGVPFVVVDMRFGISGAQDQSVFNQTLATALAEVANAPSQ